MNILIAGSGGREHALAWKLAQSPLVGRLFAVPGNPGIARVAECLPAADLSPASILAAARHAGADLTVIGPEAPLVAGVGDLFRAEGRPIVGPDAAAARLEGSKIFAKRFFLEHGIPTAAYVAASDAASARRALDRFGFPVVVKADGLAAGKGVVVARDRAEAERALARLGPDVVIEEFLAGEEVSLIALCDGRDALLFPPARDHKAAYDGDLGPNTGGMGACCDAGLLTEKQTRAILDTIIRPAVEAANFAGFLYAGLMMTSNGPRLLEFNARLGDPEAQALLPALACDLAEILMDCARGRLARHAFLGGSARSSACVVLASRGYPGEYATGVRIDGIDEAEAAGALVFHAGTRMGPGGLETAGGRVLGVAAARADLASAVDQAYAGAARIRFAGMQYRRDIGLSTLERYNTSAGT